jgi:hypothetical protein
MVTLAVNDFTFEDDWEGTDVEALLLEGGSVVLLAFDVVAA